MKKFYQKAEARRGPGGYTVQLDGKNVKTPLLHPLVLQDMALAEAVAAEWRAQGDTIDAHSMPVTQMVNTMIDKAGGPERPEMETGVVKYAMSDLVCYFAPRPQDLVKFQEKEWLPLLAWLFDTHGIKLLKVTGIQYLDQPEESLRAFRELVAGMDAADFTVLQAVTAISGSAVISLAVVQGRLDAEEAWRASCVDEIYQLEKWGEDLLARKKLERVRRELQSIVMFRNLVRPSA